MKFMSDCQYIRFIIIAISVLMLSGFCQADIVNLVKNPSFEEGSSNPWRPNNWMTSFDGNAHGSIDRIQNCYHGLSAIRVINQTQRVPGSFIRIYQSITVKPDTDYVISMYVRCKSVGYAWFGGGPKWMLREKLPQDTNGKWLRVSIPFKSDDSGRWDFMIVSEDTAESLDIDAVQIEEGKSATPFHGEIFHASVDNKSYAGIYKSPKEVAVTLGVNNFMDIPLTVISNWQLRRLPGNDVVSSGTSVLKIAADGASKVTLPFPRKATYGLYEYMVTTSAKNYIVKSEARIAIMRDPPISREMDNLGINIHVAGDDTARLMRRIGLRWARIDWHMQLCAPSKDQVIWDFIDRQVAVADKYGLKLFPIFGAGDPPAWMRLDDGTFNVQYHADYIGSILRRYRGKIPAFNVYNEPESGAITAFKNPGLWEADLKAVRKAARAADPDAMIVGIGLSGNTGDPGDWWFNPLMRSSIALGQYLDACDWHNYPAPRNRRPEETNAICSGVDGLRESVPKARAFVSGKELWITEHGFSVCNPHNPSVAAMNKSDNPMAPFEVTEKQQGDYLVRQVILELAYGIDRVFLYQLGPDGTDDSYEGQFGITRNRPNGLSAKLAYVQIANMIQELAGAVPVKVYIPSPNVRIARFHRGSTDVVAAWTVRGSAKLSFQIDDGFQGDPFGNRSPIQGAVTVKITESPIFLVGKNII
ncbi:MAG: carbohydrate binding domain-containing protein [Armatimonadota bacterium]